MLNIFYSNKIKLSLIILNKKYNPSQKLNADNIILINNYNNNNNIISNLGNKEVKLFN